MSARNLATTLIVILGATFLSPAAWAERRPHGPAEVFTTPLKADGARNAGTVLQSGVPRDFTLPASATEGLWTGGAVVSITVPAGATRLDIQLTTSTPNADLDLYVRIGSDPTVSGSSIFAEFYSETLSGNEAITIDTAGWFSSTEPRVSYATGDDL